MCAYRYGKMVFSRKDYYPEDTMTNAELIAEIRKLVGKTVRIAHETLIDETYDRAVVLSVHDGINGWYARVRFTQDYLAGVENSFQVKYLTVDESADEPWNGIELGQRWLRADANKRRSPQDERDTLAAVPSPMREYQPVQEMILVLDEYLSVPAEIRAVTDTYKALLVTRQLDEVRVETKGHEETMNALQDELRVLPCVRCVKYLEADPFALYLVLEQDGDESGIDQLRELLKFSDPFVGVEESGGWESTRPAVS